VGHPRTYSFSDTGDSRRTQTMPPNARLHNSVHLDKTQSAPTNISDSTAIPSALTPVPQSPDTATLPPSIDLETGNELPPRKRHWWSRKGESRRRSSATTRAQDKSQFTLFQDILFSSWVNVLLVFIPLGIALHFVNVNPTVVFIMNFLAIVPLAGVWFRWLRLLLVTSYLFLFA
jgi:hypothetical protein